MSGDELEEIDLAGGVMVAVDDADKPFVIIQVEFFCDSCNGVTVDKFEVKRTWNRSENVLIIEPSPSKVRCSNCSRVITHLIKTDDDDMHKGVKWTNKEVKKQYRKRLIDE